MNFKAYPAASGKKARKLGKECLEASEETGQEVVAVPTFTDILRLKDLDLETFSQHVDAVEPGSHTGHVTPESVSEAGVSGTLINHSERRLEEKEIQEAIERAREKGLTTVVCAKDPEECRRLSRFEPDYIAFEPPELIGGDVSVSEAKPELIEEAVSKSEVPVLTGAGIHSQDDVEKSIELGCKGILVASAVVKAENPYDELVELCEGL